jgi:hypothetical protein
LGARLGAAVSMRSSHDILASVRLVRLLHTVGSGLIQSLDSLLRCAYCSATVWC